MFRHLLNRQVSIGPKFSQARAELTTAERRAAAPAGGESGGRARVPGIAY